MNIRDYNPVEGMAFQGDVSIIPIPTGITISLIDEIKPIDGKLILQEGEITGHHHAIRVRNFRAVTAQVGDPGIATRDPILRRKFGGGGPKQQAPRAAIALGGARLFRDPAVPQEMIRRGILTRADLAVGVLVVDSGDEPVIHEEHDAIRIPFGDGGATIPHKGWDGGYIFQLGRYLIGRQIESVGAEERRVKD